MREQIETRDDTPDRIPEAMEFVDALLGHVLNADAEKATEVTMAILQDRHLAQCVLSVAVGSLAILEKINRSIPEED